MRQFISWATIVFAAIWILCFCGGCTAQPSGRTIINVCPKDFGADSLCSWCFEAQSTLHKPPVIFAAHGMSVCGTWFAFPDEGNPLPVETVARILKEAYPSRPVVLIVCNTEHARLHNADVWYSPSLLWIKPGPTMRRMSSGAIAFDVGSFSDFVEGRP